MKQSSFHCQFFKTVKLFQSSNSIAFLNRYSGVSSVFVNSLMVYRISNIVIVTCITQTIFNLRVTNCCLATDYFLLRAFNLFPQIFALAVIGC